MYQKLYELDVARKQLASRLEQEEAEKEGREKPAKRLLRRSVGPEEIAEVVSSWTGIAGLLKRSEQNCSFSKSVFING